jgi:hypothetical protein
MYRLKNKPENILRTGRNWILKLFFFFPTENTQFVNYSLICWIGDVYFESEYCENGYFEKFGAHCNFKSLIGRIVYGNLECNFEKGSFEN